jgi:hypothetical protein
LKRSTPEEGRKAVEVPRSTPTQWMFTKQWRVKPITSRGGLLKPEPLHLASAGAREAQLAAAVKQEGAAKAGPRR